MVRENPDEILKGIVKQMESVKSQMPRDAYLEARIEFLDVILRILLQYIGEKDMTQLTQVMEAIHTISFTASSELEFPVGYRYLQGNLGRLLVDHFRTKMMSDLS